MIKKWLDETDRNLLIYFAIIACVGLALGLSNNIFGNYFKEAYEVNGYQRGIIEFPRELPGIICTIIIAALPFLADTKIAIIAQFLSIIGIIALGLTTPVFSVMLIYLFINSLGMHLFFPLEESIGLSLAEEDRVGERMGQYKGVVTAFTMIAMWIVVIGFRTKVFSFTAPIKWVFLVSAFFSLLALLLLIYLDKRIENPILSDKKINFVFRKEYKYYYIIAIMRGVQKQIMFVYGPWVLIELLNKNTETIATITLIGAMIGVFFIPMVGKWLDRFGIKKMFYVDALSFVGVYLFYGIVSQGFANGSFPKAGIFIFITYFLLVIDRMSFQMGIIRTVYLKKIAIKESDIMPTISLSVSLDHIVSIICAYLGGIIWISAGPQYVFYAVAALSLVNLYVAIKVEDIK